MRSLKTIAGLENAKIVRYGYAVEYDYAPPLSAVPDLGEQNNFEGLFYERQSTEHQVYEEVASQGFITGVECCRRKQWEKLLLIIDRSKRIYRV